MAKIFYLTFWLVTLLPAFCIAQEDSEILRANKARLRYSLGAPEMRLSPYPIQGLQPTVGALQLGLQPPDSVSIPRASVYIPPEQYMPQNNLKSLFPSINLDISYPSASSANRLKDPYYRNDGLTGSLWENRTRPQASVAIDGLNLHDPASWFNAKKLRRRAYYAYAISHWVYSIDDDIFRPHTSTKLFLDSVVESRKLKAEE